MRQQQNRRGKNRGNQNRKVQNPLSRIYDSSGPGVKVRGNAQHIYEKYMALARDAQTSGDYIVYENFAQHAEHYKRIISEATLIPSPEQVIEENKEEDNSEDKENTEPTEKTTVIRKRPRKTFIKAHPSDTESSEPEAIAETENSQEETVKPVKKRSPRKK